MWQRIVHICVWISLLILLAVDGASFPKKDNIKLDPSALTVDERQAIGTKIQTFFASGEHVNLVNYCASLEKQYGTLDFGFSNNSSPYIFLGASLYSLHRTDDALAAFKKALITSPDNGNIHINIGEILLQTFKLDDAMASFRKAYELNNAGALPRILRTIGWSADWADLEEFVANLEVELKNCNNEDDPSTCESENAFGSEYTDASLISGIVAEFRSENNKLSPLALKDHEIAPLWDVPYNVTRSLSRKEPLKRTPQRLKVGLVSSDFNVHPVSQLIRGMIQFVDKERIELYCYSLQSKSSWWGDNITSHVEHFVSILEMNHRDAANLIAKHQIDILIDLNGHTMFSGLAIFKFRPAPIQMTFLGLPTSTASEYIDYYLGDFVSNPPEFRQEFLESMALLPPSYIVSDYAQLLGDIADRDFEARANRSCFFETPMGSSFATPTYTDPTIHQFDDASLLLATFSNSQKLDPSLFHVWMNLLSSLPGAKMLMMEYRGADYFLRNLHRVARSFGIETDRYVMVPQKSYIDHLDCKTSVDLALDTVSKNGHTTGLDALWAGIPLLSMGGRNRALARAAESMATALEHEVGLTFSLKEYEDLALRVLKAKRSSSTDKDATTASSHPRHDSHSTQESSKRTTDYASSPLLLQWRREIIRQRRASSLFNTRLFTKFFERYMESLWEIVHLQRIHPVLQHLLASSPRHQRRQRLYPNRRHFMHVFPAKSQLPDFAAQFSPLQTTTMRNSDVADPSYLHAAMNNVAVYAPNILNYTDSNVLDRCSSNKGRKPRSEYEPIPAYVFDGRNIMLNIGGIHAADGWLLVNNKRDNYFVDPVLNPVDILRDMDDLYGLPDHSVAALYCSHTLEHQTIAGDKLMTTLKEWFRVIRPGGLLLVSVPDLTVLAKMVLDPKLTMDEQWMVVKMMYGAQVDAGDFHHVGFTEEMLRAFLESAGFCEIERVGHFNLAMTQRGIILSDSSDLIRYGYFISLNLVARVCPSSKPNVPDTNFKIAHAARPYPGPYVGAWRSVDCSTKKSTASAFLLVEKWDCTQASSNLIVLIHVEQ